MENKYGTKNTLLPKQRATNAVIPGLRKSAIYNSDMTEVVMNPPYNKTEWARQFNDMKKTKTISKIICIHPTNQLENYFIDSEERPEIIEYLEDGVNNIEPCPWYMFPDANASCGDIAVSTWERNKPRKNPLLIKDRYELRYQCFDKDLYREIENNIIPKLKIAKGMFNIDSYKWGKMPEYWVFIPRINTINGTVISNIHKLVYHKNDERFITTLKKSEEYKELFVEGQKEISCISGNKADLEKLIEFWTSDFGYLLRKVYCHDNQNLSLLKKIPMFDPYQDYPKGERYAREAFWVKKGYDKWLHDNKGLKFNDYDHLSPVLKKKLGAVYTPEDFSKFMECIPLALQIDPQCGTGNILKILLGMKLKYGLKPIEALKTIRGTDINLESVKHCRDNVLEFLGLKNDKSAIEYVNKFIVCTDSNDWNYDEWKPTGLCEFLE